MILLMFGVGLHFSLARPAGGAGDRGARRARCRSPSRRCSASALACALGWPLGAGLVFGLALSVASTVVLLRALQERRLVETERGRIAVGWLIVEDLAMVLALVLLPALAGAARRHAADGDGLRARSSVGDCGAARRSPSARSPPSSR